MLSFLKRKPETDAEGNPLPPRWSRKDTRAWNKIQKRMDAAVAAAPAEEQAAWQALQEWRETYREQLKNIPPMPGTRNGILRPLPPRPEE